MNLLKLSSLFICLGLLAACSSREVEPEPPKMPPPEVSQAWLDEYQPKVAEALEGSGFELERKENILVVVAPADVTFNKDRPSMLMPSTLGPFSKVAKLVEADKNVGILILGHADSSGADQMNRDLSRDRAASVTAIFRLSGLQQDRLLRKGVGSDMPRASNDSKEGRALNRRVEIILTRQDTLIALINQYSHPAPAAPTATAAAAPAVDADKPAQAKTDAGAATPAKAAPRVVAAKEQ